MDVQSVVRTNASPTRGAWAAPPSLSGCSGRSAPRSSSSSRTAPFGAAPPPSCQPLARQPVRARAKHVSCHTSSCHPHSSGDELGGSAELPRRRCFAGPAPRRRAAGVLLCSCTQPSRELCYSTPLPQPFCEPVRLFCGCEPEELPKDPAEELPEELRMVESQKQEEKAEKTKKADAGAAVARACGVDNK